MAAAALRRKYAYLPPESSVDFLCIGAGVVGIAIGRQLSKSIADKTTFVIERCANCQIEIHDFPAERHPLGTRCRDKRRGERGAN